MTFSKKLIAILALAVPALGMANEAVQLDKAPERANLASLQNGAKLFVNYCLNCHAASAMRYNRLRDLGLTEDEIKNNLLFSQDKVGGMMTVALRPADAKAWFGTVPPDLSVIARSKASGSGTGGDYLYTYLRSFYKDDTRPTGWNNLVLKNAAMPHVMWELQGTQELKTVGEAGKKEEGDHGTVEHQLVLTKPGTMNKAEFDAATADLVAYLEWMGEPAASTRKRLGVWVVIFMSFFALLAWRLNASYWKEVK